MTYWYLSQLVDVAGGFLIGYGIGLRYPALVGRVMLETRHD